MGRVKVRDDEGKVTTPFNIALHMVNKPVSYTHLTLPTTERV